MPFLWKDQVIDTLTLSYILADEKGRYDFKTMLYLMLKSKKNVNSCTTIPLCIGRLVNFFQNHKYNISPKKQAVSKPVPENGLKRPL